MFLHVRPFRVARKALVIPSFKNKITFNSPPIQPHARPSSFRSHSNQFFGPQLPFSSFEKETWSRRRRKDTKALVDGCQYPRQSICICWSSSPFEIRPNSQVNSSSLNLDGCIKVDRKYASKAISKKLATFWKIIFIIG